MKYWNGEVSGGLQAKAYKLLHSFTGDGWIPPLLKRFSVLCPDVAPPSEDGFAALRNVLSGLSKRKGSSEAMYVLKTLTNAWATTSRYHEDDRWPCIFGCECESDSLKHYLSCDPLWTLCISHAGLGSEMLQLSPSHRLCLSNPSPDSVKVCGMACWLYHALKIGHRD